MKLLSVTLTTTDFLIYILYLLEWFIELSTKHLRAIFLKMKNNTNHKLSPVSELPLMWALNILLKVKKKVFY